MHLDGLVPCRPTLCRDESDDYAELDDVVGAGMGAEAAHMESDGFDEAGRFLVHVFVSGCRYASFVLCFLVSYVDWLFRNLLLYPCILFSPSHILSGSRHLVMGRLVTQHLVT